MLFSIVIPAYNISQYIEECVESVISQEKNNNFDFEVLLIDDGSTDETSKICDRLSSKFQEVTTFHKLNGGLSDARNYGIKKSKGDYIFFLDGDDFWSDNKFLIKIMNSISNWNPDLVLFSFSNYNNGETSTNSIKFLNSQGDFIKDNELLISKGIYSVSAWQKCIKREIILENDLKFPLNMLSEDCIWSSEVLNHIKKYSVVESYQYMYRQNRAGSITSVIKEKNVLDILTSIDLIVTKALNIEKTGQLLLASNYYLSVLPNVYKYNRNSKINYFVNKYKFLCKYYNRFENSNLRRRGLIVRIFGLKGASILLYKLKQIRSQYRKLKRV